MVVFLWLDRSLGIFDISTHVMILFSFIYALQQDHVGRLKKLYLYLYNIRDAYIKVCTEEPDYS